MDNQFAIIDKSVLHNEKAYCDFLDVFSKDVGPIEMVYQRRVRFHPDKVILEIEMKHVDSTIK